MNELVIRQYVVDAFTHRVFRGNPAAICILEHWLPDAVMQAIARENNLSETAFAVKEPTGYALRWFTPGGEIDLCGHATLACGFVLLNEDEKDQDRIVFSTQSGPLTVVRRDTLYEMDFPAYDLQPVFVTPDMEAALGVMPKEAYLGRDLVCVLEDASVVKELSPHQEALKKLPGLLTHVTAPGQGDFDCVSRSFAPKLHVAEDPVCGSGHCHIVPYWAQKLARSELVAYQASPRGGTLFCRMEGSRIIMAGHAALYARGQIHVPQSGADPWNAP